MNSSDSLQACDLCGGSRYTIISHRDRRGLPLTTGLCEGCGLVSHLPVPTEDEVAAYYANDYRRDYHGENTPSKRRIMRAWNNGARILNQLAPHIPDHINVFEIGAGIGCTVKNFEVAGHRASGIEPNKDFNAYTRNVLHAGVENRNLYDLEATGDKQLILLIHVIEHFSSPTRALTQIRGLLEENGLLYIECPNIGAPFATFGRLFHFAHIYNFTPNTLIALAAKCGFEVVEKFTDEAHPDIRILFRKTDVPADFRPDPAEAERTGSAIHRYNWLSYNLRPDYLARRLCQLGSYAGEYVKANGFVKALEARFNNGK
ncbi:MAG: class I SAM-dependent methyltransferase [Mariprofundaceae bacterium]|nr:class I SAM-dependent methyltransferase [Mariprofundaceae bacterium]